jgi:hypothetical protein
MVNLLVVMVGGDALGRGREFNLAGFAQDLAAERLRETEEAARGDLRQIALLKFLLDTLQMLGQSPCTGFPCGQKLFLNGFEFNGALVLYVELQLSTERDQCAFTRIEFLCDSGETPTFGAQFDEPLLFVDV